MNDLDGPLSLLTNTASKDAVQDIKVCVVGASKVGKTASVALLSGQKIVEDDSMSVGLRVTHTLWTCEGKTCKLKFWDVSSHAEKFSYLGENSLNGADVIVAVFFRN
eukprot:Rmarinus@m.1325